MHKSPGILWFFSFLWNNFPLLASRHLMVFQFLRSSYQKVTSILKKSGSLLGNKLRQLFQGKIDEEKLEELEQLFYESDLGVKTALELTEHVRQLLQKNPHLSGDECIASVKQQLLRQINPSSSFSLNRPDTSPFVVMIVGVNGNGKTTSTAKIAHLFKNQGERVLLGATDTFRAAAIDQLEQWGERLDIDVIKGLPKGDPAAVAYDTLQAALSREYQTVILDTAGRLHTKTHLMQELEKIRRACQKTTPSAPHETLLVLDATTGQNAIDQAKIFHKYTPITGLILTKLDGTAKGGIVIQIERELGIPVKFIGIGEGVDDFEPFDAERFISTLLE